MALQWADTFNKYGTNAALLLNGLYAETNWVTLVTDPDPTSTQIVLRHSASNFVGSGYRFAFPSGAKATMGFAVRVWLAALPSVSSSLPGWELRDVNNTAQVSIRINTTGAISVLRGTVNGGTVIGTTTLPVLSANAYNHIEVKATIDSSAGAVEVRINGSPVLTLTGVNTQATALSTVAQMAYWATTDSGVVSYHKDYVVWDTTGSFNNNFLGAVLCTEIYPDGDNTFTWTASTGTNGWSILDNNPPLDDSAYISAASNLTSKYTLLNLPANVSSVKGNIIVTRARKTDSGDGNIQAGLVSGASTSLGANRAITTAYTYWVDVNETDPATGAAWTPVAFNAALLQLARTV